ncbi:GTPase family protein [Edwardsiella tarda]|uniref:GTPase family protein n=1 Tax=Edwardsiella tarda TaxID=636 RepID=UPI003B5116F2
MDLLLNRLQNEIQARGLLYPLDVLLVGATGSGKSSTINAMSKGGMLAKVGHGVAPETQVISDYRLHNYLRIHDSAGLGDSKEADLQHACDITKALRKRCSINNYALHPYALIDMVLVILEGGLRDLGTAFQILQTVILQDIEPERVVVVINQADQVMKGRHWNYMQNYPDAILAEFLEEKAISVQRRIKESTGVSISKPICYSAEYGYNVDAVLEHLINHLPKTRRII